MKRLFKNWAGRHSPSPRRKRTSRHCYTSKRADVRDHDQLPEQLPEVVPLTFIGYQHFNDGTLQPVYSATGEHHQNDAETNDGKLVDSVHFCYKCGRARSKGYHMDNPVKPGHKVPAGCCARCRKKNTGTEPCLKEKYLQHFCIECGRVRSRSYHNEHPVRAGHKTRPSYCIKCRMRRKEEANAKGEGEWEDIDDAGESTLTFLRLKNSRRKRFVDTENGPIQPSDSEEAESDSGSGATSSRRPSKESTRLSVPATGSRKTSEQSARSTRSFQASGEEAPPTPPHTPSPIIPKRPIAEKKQNAEKKQTTEKKVAFEEPKKDEPAPSAPQTTVAATQTTVPAPAPASNSNLVVSPKFDCKSHVHVVYVHPPCYHHAHDGHDQPCQGASTSCISRGRRPSSSDNNTTTSSKQSRRVAFATPEVSSRHEADADYDRTAVPENHDEDPFDFGLHSGPPGGNHHARGFDADGRPHRTPTPGPNGPRVDSSSGPSSAYDSSSGRPDRQPMDSHSPPPEYSAPPPKVLTPEEIRRLWEPQPERLRHSTDRRNDGPLPARDFLSHNRAGYAPNHRSFSEGSRPAGFGNGSQHFSNHNRDTGRPANPGAPDHRASDNRRPSDSRYKNDENIDPKTRYNTNNSTSRPSQPRARDAPPQQGANMYNNTNRNNEYNSASPSQSRGPARPSQNNSNMYNGQTNASSSNRPTHSHGRPSEYNNPNMYNSQTNASNNTRPTHSRTSSGRSENPNMYNDSNNSGSSDYRSTRPSSSQPNRPRSRKDEPRRNTSRQTSGSAPANEAPFTARERMWTDGPEHARKLREAMERLERAAAANTTKMPECPPTPEFAAPPAPDFDSGTASGANVDGAQPDVSTPDFGGSDKGDFASGSTRNFGSAGFASDMPDFGSETRRNFSSDTRNFSSGTARNFTSGSPPPGFSNCRKTSASTWEHPCGPYCNEFCPDRADHVAREIVEIDSDEEREILGGRKVSTSKKASSAGKTVRKGSSSDNDRAARLALVRRRPAVSVATADTASPAKSVGSTYYTASETSRS